MTFSAHHHRYGANVRGTVKFFSTKRGFGFITGEDGEDVYFNKASLRRDRMYDPVEGDPVTFEIREIPSGKMAHRIEQIEPAT